MVSSHEIEETFRPSDSSGEEFHVMVSTKRNQLVAQQENLTIFETSVVTSRGGCGSHISTIPHVQTGRMSRLFLRPCLECNSCIIDFPGLAPRELMGRHLTHRIEVKVCTNRTGRMLREMWHFGSRLASMFSGFLFRRRIRYERV